MPSKSLTAYNLSGKTSGKISLPPIFAIKPNLSLVAQAIANIQYNLRARGGHTKDRSERSGGGRKPWRQKGTGKARVGSIRSPLWRKGGVIFGPKKDKPRRRKLGKSERNLVLTSILSQKLIDKEIIVVKKLTLDERKTKKMVEILARLPLEDSALIVIAKNNEKIQIAARNIPLIKVCKAANLSILDLLTYRYLVLTADSIAEIQKVYSHD